MDDWKQLCEFEPRLRALFREVPAIMSRDRNPWICWSIIKRRMCKLVGWECGNPALAETWIYDLAYRTLLAEAERNWCAGEWLYEQQADDQDLCAVEDS